MKLSEILLWQEALIKVMGEAIPKDRALWSFCNWWYWSLRHHVNPDGFLRESGGRRES